MYKGVIQMNITQTVCDIVKNELRLDDNTILNEDTLLDELGADSLDAVEIVMALEDEFSIEISDEDVERVRSIGDMVKIISELAE